MPRRLGVPPERRNSAYAAADLVYNQGLTQQQAAKRLHISRATVVRLLGLARDLGLVRVLVVPHSDEGVLVPLEAEIRRRFPCLRRAVVLPGRGDLRDTPADDAVREAVVASLAQAAAREMQPRLRGNAVVAVPWGQTAMLVVRHLAVRQPQVGVTAVPLVGALSTGLEEFEASAVARQLALTIGGRYLALVAPAVIDDPGLVAAIHQHPLVAQVFDALRTANVVLVTVKPAPSLRQVPNQRTVQEGLIGADYIREAVKRGAVGELCQWYFDDEGRAISCGKRTILGLGLDELKVLAADPGRDVVCVAGGEPSRVQPLAAALRGGLANILVTDDVTAARLAHG